jgi:hypothetical protein
MLEREKDPFKDKHIDPKNSGSTTLTVNGLHCTFNMPEAVARKHDAQGNEITASLPPYRPRIGYPVDKFPASPGSWMHGSGKASSYFVPIIPEHGMWLDFNQNTNHSHHVAAVISVQGINPLTGMKADPIRLEQYKDKCPKHGESFLQDRYCPTCKFEWHPQNYLSSNSGGPFWIDGFRTEDGVIRQWYFTEEECKGVAAQLIGAERVFAIGIAFYLSKQPKPVRQYTSRGISVQMCSLGGGPRMTNFIGAASYSGKDGVAACSSNTFLDSYEPLGDVYDDQRLGSFEAEGGFAEAISIEKSLKKLEIGAGAKIHQKIGADPEKLDFWQDEPAGMLYINYCDVSTAERILAAGQRQQKADGFLAGVKLKD